VFPFSDFISGSDLRCSSFFLLVLWAGLGPSQDFSRRLHVFLSFGFYCRSMLSLVSARFLVVGHVREQDSIPHFSLRDEIFPRWFLLVCCVLALVPSFHHSCFPIQIDSRALAAGSKARVFLVFGVLPWCFLGHAHQVFSKMFMRQWEARLSDFGCCGLAHVLLAPYCLPLCSLTQFWGSIVSQ
jgi:hypothetical protein